MKATDIKAITAQLDSIEATHEAALRECAKLRMMLDKIAAPAKRPKKTLTPLELQQITSKFRQRIYRKTA